MSIVFPAGCGGANFPKISPEHPGGKTNAPGMSCDFSRSVEGILYIYSITGE